MPAIDISDQKAGPLAPTIPPLFVPEEVLQLKPCRQGSVEPYSPISGPDAWYGEQQRRQMGQWVHQLTDKQIHELEAAVAAVQQKLKLQTHGNYITGLMRLRRPEDFALPLLAPVLSAMKQELSSGRGFYLIKRLPVQRWSRQQVIVAYWGIGLHLGVAIPQNQKGHLIGHVKDVGVDLLCDNPSTRIYMTRAAQPWHVDSCDVVGLLCLSTAKRGGLSSWASSSTIYNELLTISPQAVATMAGTWYLDRKGEVPEGKLPFFTMPILHFHEGYMTVSFHDTYYQNAASRFPGQVPPLTPDQLAALQLFNEVANRPDVRLDYQLEPGDMQFLNNHNIVHTRTQFEDWEDPSRKRHLLRLQLVVPDLRPLPAAGFDALWGPMAASDRCAQQLAALPDAAELELQASQQRGPGDSAENGGVAAACGGGNGEESAAAAPVYVCNSRYSSSSSSSSSNSSISAAAGISVTGQGADHCSDVATLLAARFGGSGMGCVPLDAEVGNILRD